MPIATSGLRDRVTRFVGQMGTSRGASELGVSREALVRVVANLDVRAGTLALIEQKLDKIAPEAPEAPPAAPAAPVAAAGKAGTRR